LKQGDIYGFFKGVGEPGGLLTKYLLEKGPSRGQRNSKSKIERTVSSHKKTKPSKNRR